MKKTEETCWTLVRGAADGAADDRAVFAEVYLPVVRAYLVARWRGGPLLDRVDDAVQDTFVECFRDDGALGRIDPGAQGRFRTFLFAVVRNLARRHEERAGRDGDRHGGGLTVVQPTSGAAPLSHVFDRAWLDTLLRRAAERQARWAAAKGPEAQQRVAILRERFVEDLPVREIAKRRGVGADVVHREYRQARREFKRALREEVAFHHPGGTPEEIEKECEQLLALLS